MTQWFKEYDAFLEHNFKALLQQHGIENMQDIQPYGEAWLAVQQKLQDVENAWALSVGKQAATVVLVAPESTVSRFQAMLGAKPTKIDAEHNYEKNQHHIPWNFNSNEFHPFELLRSLRHESEHGSQSVGLGYSTAEKQLVWIERACRHALEPHYWAKFTEMSARMSEVEWCTAMMNEHAAYIPIQDRQALLNVATSSLGQLMSQCTAADYTARNTALQKAIHHSEYEELKQGFSETRERDILHAAKQLVKYTSRQLYRDCETKLQAVQQQFATDIATWELRLPKEAEKEKQKQERAVVSAIATQYGIPVLTDMPDGVIAVPLQSGYTAETLQNLTAKHHSPAIVLFSNKEAQLIYDIAPTPRSYSTSPALRTQWQIENEGQNENPAEPIEHSGHDDRFD